LGGSLGCYWSGLGSWDDSPSGKNGKMRDSEVGCSERDRLQAMLQEEERVRRMGKTCIAGVDEVGLGPLAGPVVAAAVIMPLGSMIEGVDDSKVVPRRRRERLAQIIRESAVSVGIGVVEPEEIDRINIYQAGLKAMRIAVERLTVRPDHLLVDGRAIPGTTISQTRLIKGDARVYSIAAASIIAKVFRDAIMRELDGTFPGYGFAQHVGYATRKHLEALEALGPARCHRRSFAPVRRLVEAGRKVRVG